MAENVVRVCGHSEVGPETAKAYEVGDKRLAVYNLGGEFYVTDDEWWIVSQATGIGSGHDPELLRAAVDLGNPLASPAEVLARPGIAAALAPYLGQTPGPAPGPSRAEFLGLLESGI